MVKGCFDCKVFFVISYCWIIWLKDYLGGIEFGWIELCCVCLERVWDYFEVSIGEFVVVFLFDGGELCS